MAALTPTVAAAGSSTSHQPSQQQKQNTPQASPVHDADSPGNQSQLINDAQLALCNPSSPKSPIYSLEQKTELSFNGITKDGDKGNIGRDSDTNRNSDEESNQSKENNLPFVNQNLSSNSSNIINNKSPSNGVLHSPPGSPSQTKQGSRRNGMRGCDLCLNQRSQTLPQYEAIVLLRRLEEGLSQGDITSLQSSGMLQLVTSQCQSNTVESKDSEFNESDNDPSDSMHKDKENINAYSEILYARPTVSQLDGHQQPNHIQNTNLCSEILDGRSAVSQLDGHKQLNHIQNELDQTIQTAADHDTKSVTPVLSELPSTTHLHSQHTLVSSNCSIGSSSPEKSKHENLSQFVSSTSQVSPSYYSSSQTEATAKASITSQPLTRSTEEAECVKDLDKPLNNNEDTSSHTLIAKDSVLPKFVTECSISPIKSKTNIVSVSENKSNSSNNEFLHGQPLNSTNEKSCIGSFSLIKLESTDSHSNEKNPLSSMSSILMPSPDNCSLHLENIRSEQDNLSDIKEDSADHLFCESSVPLLSITQSNSSPTVSTTSSSNATEFPNSDLTCENSVSKNITHISDSVSQKTNTSVTSHLENTICNRTNEGILPTVERISENNIDSNEPSNYAFHKTDDNSTNSSDCISSCTETGVTYTNETQISTTEFNSEKSKNSFQNKYLHEPSVSKNSDNHLPNLSSQSTASTSSPISEDANNSNSFEETAQNSSNSKEKNMPLENTSTVTRSTATSKTDCTERKTINSPKNVLDSFPTITEDIQDTESTHLSSKYSDSQLSKHSKDIFSKPLTENDPEYMISALESSKNCQQNCSKENFKQNLLSFDPSEDIELDQSSKNSFDIDKCEHSNSSTNTLKANESKNLVELSSSEKSESYFDLQQGYKSSSENIDNCKDTDSDKNKSISDSNEEYSIVTKRQKSLQACTLNTDEHNSKLAKENEDDVKPQSCFLKTENKSDNLSNLSVDISSCKPKIGNENLQPSSGSPKSELLQSPDNTLDTHSPNSPFEHELISTFPESPQNDFINIQLSEGSTRVSESKSPFPSTSESSKGSTCVSESKSPFPSMSESSEGSTCVSESKSPFPSTSESPALNYKENIISASMNEPYSDTDCKNVEINPNNRTQECEVIQSSTSCNESNKGIKMRIKTKLAPTSLTNGDNPENSESAIPKLVLTWKGNGSKKEYSLTNKVETSEDVDTLDITCKKQKSKKEKKHKIRHKEKTKKHCKVTKSKRHVELFGEDSNDSCDSSFKGDLSSKSDNVLENTVIPHHDSQSSVNLPFVGESPQHSGYNSPILHCRTSYEFSENVEKVCERLQTKTPIDSSDESLSDSLPDIELPKLVDHETYESESQISSLVENKVIDSNVMSNDQKISVVDNEASEDKKNLALNKLEINIDHKSDRRESPDSLTNTNTQEISSKSQKCNTSTPIMIGGKPTATVEPYCRDNKRKIENISSQMPKLELISEECMFSKSSNKEIIFGRSNRNDHNLLLGENQKVQVVIPTKINVQKHDLEKHDMSLPKGCVSKTDEKDFESYKSIYSKPNMYQTLPYDMLYSSSKSEKDNFVVNFLSDTKFNKQSTIFNHSYINGKHMSSQSDNISKIQFTDNVTTENRTVYSSIRPKSWPSALVYSSDKFIDIKYSKFSSKDDIFMNNTPRNVKNYNNTLPKSINNSILEKSSKQKTMSSEPENANVSSAGNKVSETYEEVAAEEMHETQLTIDEGTQEPENRESDDDLSNKYQSITIFSDLTKEDEEYKKKNVYKPEYINEITQKYNSKDKKLSNNNNNNSSDESESKTNTENQYDPEFEKVWGERARKCKEKKLKRLQLKRIQKHGAHESKDDLSPALLSPISPHPPPIPDMALSPINEISTENDIACESKQEESEKKIKNEKEKKTKDDCDKKKRGRRKKEINESDSDTDSCIEGGIEAGTQARTVVLEEERDRRLAQEIPGFNWLEQKIKNGTISKPSNNIPLVKSSNTTINYSQTKEFNSRGAVSTRNTAPNLMCQQGMPTNTHAFGFNNDVAPSLGESSEKNGKENTEVMRRHSYGCSPSLGVRTHLQTAVPIVPPSRVTALPKRRMSPTASNFQQHQPTSSNMLPNVKMSSQASTAAALSDSNSNSIYSSHKSYQATQQLVSQEQMPNYVQYPYQQPQMSLHPDKQHMSPHIQHSSMQQQHIPQVHNQMLMQPIAQQNQHKPQQPSQHGVPPQIHQLQQPAHDQVTPSKVYHGNQGNIQHYSMISGPQEKSFQYNNIKQYEPQILIPEEQMSRNSCSYQQEYNPIPNSQKSYQRQQSLPYHQSSQLSQPFTHQQYSTHHTKVDTEFLKQEGEITHKQFSDFPSCQVKDDKKYQKHPTNTIKIDTPSDDSNAAQNKHEYTTVLHELHGNNVKFSQLVEDEHDINLENIQEKREHKHEQGISSSEELRGISDDSKGSFKTQKEISEAPKLTSEPLKEVSDTSKGTTDNSTITSNAPNESSLNNQEVDQSCLNNDQSSSETSKTDTTSHSTASCLGKDKISSGTGGVAFSPKLHILKRAFSDMLKSETQSDGSELPDPKKPHLDLCSDSIVKPTNSVISSTPAETVVRSSVINYNKNESKRETKSALDIESIVEGKDSDSNLVRSISHTDKEDETKVKNPSGVENKLKDKIDLPSEINPKLTLNSSEKESNQNSEVEIPEYSAKISMLMDELRRTKEEVAKLKRVQEQFLTDKDKNDKECTQVKENSSKEEKTEVSNNSQKEDKDKSKNSGDEVLSNKNDPDIIIEGEFEYNKSAKISIRNDLIQGAGMKISSKDESVKEMNRLKTMFGISNSEVEVVPITVLKNTNATHDLQRSNSADNLKQKSPSPNLMTKTIKESQGNNDCEGLCASSFRFDGKLSEVDITLTSNPSPHRLQPSPHSGQPSPQGLQPSPLRIQPSPQRPIPSPQRLGPSPIRQQPSPHRSQISPHSENIWYDYLKQTKPQMINEEPKRLRYSTSDLPDPPMKPSPTMIRRHSDTAEIIPIDPPNIKSPKVHSTSYPITHPNSTHGLGATRLIHEIPHSNKSSTDQLSSSSHKCIHGRNSSECRDCLMRTVGDHSGSKVHSYVPDKAKIFPVTRPPPLHVHSYKSSSPVSTMSHSLQESYNRALHYQQILSNIQNSYDSDHRKPISEIPTSKISTDLNQGKVIPPEHQHHRGMFGAHFQGFNSVSDKGIHSYQETPRTLVQPIQNTGPQTFAPRVLVHSGRPPFREPISDSTIHRHPTARHIYPGNPYHPHNPRLQFPRPHFIGGQIPPSNISHPRLPMAPSMVSKQSPDPGPSASTGSGNLKQDGKGGGGSEKKTCFNCPQQAKFLCSGCKKAWYCSEDCQRTHWHTHSASCVP